MLKNIFFIFLLTFGISHPVEAPPSAIVVSKAWLNRMLALGLGIYITNSLLTLTNDNEKLQPLLDTPKRKQKNQLQNPMYQ